MTFAHAGHWLIGLLQFVPVLGFIGWLVIAWLRDRRRRRAGGPAEPGAGEAAASQAAAD